MIKLSPSILSADFGNLARDVKNIELGGAHYLHIDVMDGNFVPNISIGLPVIKSIRNITNMTFDVHLMIDKPERYVEQFAKAGADIITIHLESTEKVEETLVKIKELGKSPALAIKPDTKYEEVIPYLHLIDMVLVMTVEPGFGGQSLITHTLNKVEKLSHYIKSNNLLVDIQVDGGISIENVDKVIGVGANIVVAGSAVFANDSIGSNIEGFYNKFETVELI